MGEEKEKLRYTSDEHRQMASLSTQVYIKSVMQKLFQEHWSDYSQKLFSGDRTTLDLCVNYLAKNLDFFPLLHTLCLVTGQKFDLDQKDPVKAADAWLCWFSENKSRLAWDKEQELWRVDPSRVC